MRKNYFPSQSGLMSRQLSKVLDCSRKTQGLDKSPRFFFHFLYFVLRLFTSDNVLRPSILDYRMRNTGITLSDIGVDCFYQRRS